MTDLRQAAQQALAIGWRKTCESTKTFWVVEDSGNKRVFSHKDWNVIGPIASRYRLEVNFRNNTAFLPDVVRGTWADTPQKAIALAVIGALK